MTPFKEIRNQAALSWLETLICHLLNGLQIRIPQLTSEVLLRMKLSATWSKTIFYNNSYLAQHTSLAIYSTYCYVTLPKLSTTFPFPIPTLHQFIVELEIQLKFKNATKMEILMVCVIISHDFLLILLQQLILMTVGNNGKRLF